MELLATILNFSETTFPKKNCHMTVATTRNFVIERNNYRLLLKFSNFLGYAFELKLKIYEKENFYNKHQKSSELFTHSRDHVTFTKNNQTTKICGKKNLLLNYDWKTEFVFCKYIKLLIAIYRNKEHKFLQLCEM